MLTSTSLCSGIALLPYAVRALHDFSSLLSHFGVHTFFPNVSVIFFFFIVDFMLMSVGMPRGGKICKHMLLIRSVF